MFTDFKVLSKSKGCRPLFLASYCRGSVESRSRSTPKLRAPFLKIEEVWQSKAKEAEDPFASQLPMQFRNPRGLDACKCDLFARFWKRHQFLIADQPLHHHRENRPFQTAVPLDRRSKEQLFPC